MILRALADWLAALPPLAQYAEGGIATGMAAPRPGCALCDDGEARRTTDISGRSTETRRYQLYVRAACLCEAQRAALADACGRAAAAIGGAEAADALPVLPAPYGAEALRCAGMRLAQLDDSGLAAYQLTLLLTFRAP